MSNRYIIRDLAADPPVFLGESGWTRDLDRAITDSFRNARAFLKSDLGRQLGQGRKPRAVLLGGLFARQSEEG